MRKKLAAAFALGIAAGMAVLALTLGLQGPGGRVESLQAVVMAARLSAAPLTAGKADRFSPEPVSTEPASPEQHLAMPLANVDPGKLAATFGERRNGHAHEGLDILAQRGTPVFAVTGGSVVKLFMGKPDGLTVYQFDDSRKWCYSYAHLDRYEAGVKEGTPLRQGDVLGYVGSTGDAAPDAPHLHFAVFQLGPEKQWWKGTAIDPLPLLK